MELELELGVKLELELALGLEKELEVKLALDLCRTAVLVDRLRAAASWLSSNLCVCGAGRAYHASPSGVKWCQSSSENDGGGGGSVIASSSASPPSTRPWLRREPAPAPLPEAPGPRRGIPACSFHSPSL